MARAIRIEYPGAAYHVMARENQGRAIFADGLDCRLWLQTLAEACEKTGWRWISERLWMGEESGVSKAIRGVKEYRHARLNRLMRRLLKGVRTSYGNEKTNRVRPNTTIHGLTRLRPDPFMTRLRPSGIIGSGP